MPADQDHQGGGREEFEVAYYTKELGRALQRQLLAQRLADLCDSAPSAPVDQGSPEGGEMRPPEASPG